MAHPQLTLDRVSLSLPDGRVLFTDLTAVFDQQPTGLVGRNGVGKTLLARILAGELTPTTGQCTRNATVYHLSQQITRIGLPTVAALAGVADALAALRRIESGSTRQADFDTLDDRWDLPQRLRAELARNALGHLSPETPAHALSGGEAMRVALIGAMLSAADVLILDEPSNHLDRKHRRALIEQLRRWSGGLLVISHDRRLLETMTRIVELSPLGLRPYGGGYSHYAQCRAQQRERATQHLEQCKLARRREQRTLREQRERQARRQARGHRNGREANQSKLLLDRQKGRSEVAAGKLRHQQRDTQARLDQRVDEAARQLPEEAAIVLRSRPVEPSAQRAIAVLDCQLPFVPAATRHLRLTLNARQRLGVIGPNGYGKSTLLRLLAGQLAPAAGRCEVIAERAYLDQHLDGLAPQRSVIAQLREIRHGGDEGGLRERLAQLDLDAGKIHRPSASLSGGERLKAALARALHAEPPARLLLLDEPSNHLDLPSLLALEKMLRHYQGALVVVSHDDAFLEALDLTERLVGGAKGWRLESWT